MSVHPTTVTTSTESPAADIRAPLSPTAPLLMWLGLQLLVLLLPVTGVPLSDQYPRPAEGTALEQMLLAQFVFSALFFPFLFRRSTSVVLVLVSAWPFIQAAGSFTGASQKTLLISGLFVTFWLALLWTWGVALRTRAARHAGGATASCLALFGPILWYVNAEYGSGSSAAVEGILAIVSPSVAAIQQLRSSEVSRGPFVFLAVLMLLSLTPFLSRHLVHRSSTVP